jgi:hypothetical protein
MSACDALLFLARGFRDRELVAQVLRHHHYSDAAEVWCSETQPNAIPMHS